MRPLQKGTGAAGIVALLILAILLAGCTTTSAPAGTGQPSRENPPPPAIAADLQQAAESSIEGTGIPGAQIGVATPAWTWNSAAGNASPITGEPARPGMRFLIASVSKTFTAATILKLAEEGKISIEDPIDRWLPADLADRIPNGHRITVRQLLDHTSGIADYNETAINLEEFASPDTAVPYQEGIEQALRNSPLYEPGTGYTYSNVNYILLTLIADKAAGVPYEDYATRHILVPAGLNDTFFQETNRIPGLHMEATLPGVNGTFLDFTNLYVRFDRGAGDIVSTTDDLNRYHRALRSGRIISNASFAMMETPNPVSGKTGYGLGYMVQRIDDPDIVIEGHTGGYPGSFTCWYYLPAQDAYVTYNVNSIGTSLSNIVQGRQKILRSVVAVSGEPRPVPTPGGI